MREIKQGIETKFLEKIIYNPLNQKIWKFLAKTSIFKAGIKVSSKIYCILNHFNWNDYDLYAIPLSHLDAAWLWTLKDTVFRAYKTFKMALEHIEQHPFFVISLTSPQYFEWMEKYYKKLPSPDPKRNIWNAICYQVNRNKIDLCGGSWIEPDLNIPCGEALIRQRLYGQLYYLRKFGKNAKIATLLDVFGYPNTIPQIFAKSGAEAFWTTKITWNDYTMWPFANFIWQGLDGTRLFTHQFKFNTMALMDLGRYKVMARRAKKRGLIFNSDNLNNCEEMAPIEIAGTKLSTKNYSGLKELAKFLKTEYIRTLGIFYGWGDGGKGPLDTEIDLMNILGKFYSIKHITTTEYFDKLKRDVGEDLVIWDDEMYLEYHRGTLTTQSLVKQGNRRAENLLIHAEMLWTLLLMDNKRSFNRDTYILFKKCWKYLLVNQFHDILPGSSIPEVYIRTWREHKFIIKEMEAFIFSFLKEFKKPGKILIYNALPVLNSAYIPFNTSSICKNDIPPFSLQEIDLSNLNHEIIKNPVQIIQSEADIICSNQKIIAIFSKNDGNLKELFWKRTADLNYHSLIYPSQFSISNPNDLDFGKLKLLNRFKGARIKVYNENFKGNFFPAWNISKNYTQNPIKINFNKIEIIESSQSCVQLQTNYSFLKSSIQITYTLFHNSPMLDIKTKIDLQDKEVLIKHFFPLNLKSNDINCETQFGVVKRARIPVTKMQAAKWEFSMQKWLDVSEDNYGLAVLNRDRYGASANKKGISITLVRSPPYPSDAFYSHEKLFYKDERPSHTDLMKHEFCYALFPHKGSWKEAKVPAKALAYNIPCFYSKSKKTVDEIMDNDKEQNSQTQIKFPNIEVSAPNVILSALKPGEWILQDEKNENLEGFIHSGYKLTKNEDQWIWDEKHVILRVYEAQGKKSDVNIKFLDFSDNFCLKSVEKLDLLERKEGVLNSIESSKFTFTIAPFEILTFRLIFDK